MITDGIISEINKITDVYKSGFTLADTTMGMLKAENAKLKAEIKIKNAQLRKFGQVFDDFNNNKKQ